MREHKTAMQRKMNEKTFQMRIAEAQLKEFKRLNYFVNEGKEIAA